ncbi:MAG: formimidoylglutamate deiminase [Halobacteriovorax sp.]|nr:formimidoylglutamate deiminase [Halobacteriovorax sp.]|tara:strand:- start:149578 stop:150852 length:1275 start_codon:yes stop_codon:yes gene_type:complete
MKTYLIKKLLQKDGWKNELYITVDENNLITELSNEKPEGEFFPMDGYLIPGFKNAHSHAFQYAMGGLNESIPESAEGDDFWSWRENMYSLALSISPDELQEIATNLYMEMRRHGYTHVAEFHYLHHDTEGLPYKNPAEMSERLMVAANQAGLALTLVPIFYQMGGFNLEPNERQRRFISKDVDSYLELYEEIKKSAEKFNNVIVGAGVHSLRAVKNEDIIKLFKKLPSGIPKHIHISEQIMEVRDCVSHLGKRPVEWLCENVKLNEEFHLVHSTHINDEELKMIIDAKANVVLCPSTEANLGDGLFPLKDFHLAGGNYSIGTDSHIGLSPMEELRWMEYGVRLIEKKRNPLCKPGENSADLIFHKTQEAGLMAMGRSANDYFEVGNNFGGLLIQTDNPLFKDKPEEAILSTLIYSAGPEHLKYR